MGRRNRINRRHGDTERISGLRSSVSPVNPFPSTASVANWQLRLAMTLVDRDSFRLVNRGFTWIQEYPFNR